MAWSNPPRSREPRKPFPSTHKDLKAAGYTYTGEGTCRGCGEKIYWYRTPKEKKIPMSLVRGSHPPRCEAHWVSCPNAEDFR